MAEYKRNQIVKFIGEDGAEHTGSIYSKKGEIYIILVEKLDENGERYYDGHEVNVKDILGNV